MEDAALPAGRFVVQAHDAPPLHYDLMLEHAGALRTFGIPVAPDALPGPVVVEPKPDHRLAYLDYAGEVAGGRGHTAPWDRGTYRARRWEPGAVEVELAGERWRGRYLLSSAGGGWMLTETGQIADGPGRAPRAARRRAGRPLVVWLLLVGGLCTLGGIVAWKILYDQALARYHGQPYIALLEDLRGFAQDLDRLRASAARARLADALKGRRITVYGRVGVVAPTDDPAQLRLWVDVPNLVEEANADRQDIECTVPASLCAPQAIEGSEGHAHPFQPGTVVVVEGTVEAVVPVDARARVRLADVTVGEPTGFVERRVFRRAAQDLGVRSELKGLTNLRGGDRR